MTQRLSPEQQSIVAGALSKGEDDVVRRLVAACAGRDAGTPAARGAAEMFGRAHLLGTGD